MSSLSSSISACCSSSPVPSTSSRVSSRSTLPHAVFHHGSASSGSGSGSESTGSSVSPSSSRSSSSPGSAKAGGGGGASEPVVTRATRLSAMARMVWLCSARATSSSRPSAALPPPSCSARPSSPCSAAAAVAASWSSSRLSSSGFRPRADSPAETRRSRSCETRSSASSAARSETACSSGLRMPSSSRASARRLRRKEGGSADSKASRSVAGFSSSRAVREPTAVLENSVSRLRSVTSQMRTMRTTSRCVRRKPCTREAMSSAAPQMPDGRRPVWIQSRRIRCTRRSADMETKCVLSPSSSLEAKRWM
mmetsp:Transcript_81034/g.196645  ORF Transcript_81034/g.196645 Transcript_81034/m.196645 type:complete len:309 (-) Transcript_81034:594-1520(-)